MQLRNKYFPYPIIVENGEYYVDSKFISKVGKSIEGYDVILTFDVVLENNELDTMLKNEDVVILHHIECPQTCLRRIVRTQNYNHKYILRDADINGTVQVCTFLVANKNLDKYTNSLFSSDYKGFKFNIEKGCVLAIGNQYNLTVNKIKDDFVNTASIFSIVPNKDPQCTTMIFDLEHDKIIISLPEKTYHQYCNCQENMEIQPLMHAMVIVPALIHIFSELRYAGEQLDHYEGYRWFRSLRKTCNAMGQSWDDGKLERLDIVKVSQLLLNSPVSKAIEFCAMGGGSYED